MVFLRKQGRMYYVYFRLNGIQKKRSTKTANKKLAEEIKKSIEDQIASEKFDIAYIEDPKTIGDFFKEAILHSATNKSELTTERETQVFANFKKFTDNIFLKDINIKLIEDFKSHFLKDHTPGGLNLNLRHLKAAFSLAVKYGYIKENPFKAIDFVKEDARLPRYLTGEEMEAIIETAKDRKIFTAIQIGRYSGARLSEICNLKWDDVNFHESKIRVFRKGSKEQDIPIPKVLNDYLKSIFADRKDEFVLPGSRNSKEVSRQFKKIVDDTEGINRISFHCLRHTFASNLVQAGRPLLEVKDLLGHTDMKTTLIYAHLAPENLKDAVAIFDK